MTPHVKDIYLPSPSWGNHQHIFRTCGIDVKSYAYLDQSTRTSLDFDSMKRDLAACPVGSVVLLHACACALRVPRPSCLSALVQLLLG